MGKTSSWVMLSIGLVVIALSFKVGEFWTDLVYKDSGSFYSEHLVVYSIAVVLIGFSLLLCGLLKLVFKKQGQE